MSTRKRGTVLTAVLVCIGLGSLWGTYRNAEIYWDLVSHDDPTVPHFPFLAFSILGILSLTSIIGLWIWKKWGFYLFAATQILGILVSTLLIPTAGLLAVIGATFLGLIGPAILLTMFYLKWGCLE